MKRYFHFFGRTALLGLLALAWLLPGRPALGQLEDPGMQTLSVYAYNELWGTHFPPRTLLDDTQLASLYSFSHSGTTRHYLTSEEVYVESLAGIEAMVSLQSLGLTDHRITDLTPLNSLGRLQWLVLEQGTVESLPVMDAMASLTELDISDNAIWDLASFAAPASLWRLDLSANELIDISALPAALADCEGLARLDLRGNPLDPADFDAVSAALLAGHPDLEILADAPAARGDINLDGAVDIADFAAFKQHYGDGRLWSQGDINGDGQTDIADFVLLKQNYGAATAGGGIVPEPASSSLLLAGLLGLLNLRPRRNDAQAKGGRNHV